MMRTEHIRLRNAQSEHRVELWVRPRAYQLLLVHRRVDEVLDSADGLTNQSNHPPHDC